MENIIIIGIIAVLLVIGLRSTKKHFSDEELRLAITKAGYRVVEIR